MKKIHLLLLLSIIFSCTNRSTYTYVQVNEYGNKIVKDEPIFLKFNNDSLAYVKFYENFYLHVRVSERIREKDKSHNLKPLYFLLYNSQGELLDIPISTKNRDLIYDVIETKIDSVLSSM